MGCYGAGRREFGGKVERPRFREFPPRTLEHLTLLLALHLTGSLSVPPLIWKKIVAVFFLGQIPGLKCKLMILSFNHSGANPDAEEFPADSGSSDFTNPRQHHPLKRCSCCCSNPHTVLSMVFA